MDSSMQQHGSKYPYPQTSPLIPTPDPAVGPIGQKSTFSEHGHVAYQIKWNHECSNMVVHIFSSADPTPPTLSTLGVG